ncbi:DUF6544 family protein [Roseivivax sp. CAU 1753]
MALLLGGGIGLTLSGLFAMRARDHRADAREAARLLTCQPRTPPRFDASMLDGLPAPAVRFFTYAIAEGTPLYTVARFAMRGQFNLVTKAAPNVLQMTATQTLAAPEGFVWAMSARSRRMRLSGSDTGDWTRFWVAGLLPVARIGGTEDHRRAAFGRCIAEALIWTPAALLPGPDVVWEAVDPDTARVTVRHAGMTQAVDLAVGPDGQPLKVWFQRWSDANPDKTYRLQPFGAELSEFRKVQGFCVPMRAVAGNFFGTDAYYPFYVAEITTFKFPEGAGD